MKTWVQRIKKKLEYQLFKAMMVTLIYLLSYSLNAPSPETLNDVQSEITCLLSSVEKMALILEFYIQDYISRCEISHVSS